ncbi:MAG TPA: STAS domain-containing protein [Gaiellaceae bacterium]|jgi:anti-sigma B factor antagonist|nr:STAS domain-containing protein [Gaiellaceae bacterium]
MLEAPPEPANDGTFRIDEERLSPTAIVLMLHGEADLHAAPQLRDRLRTAMDGGATGLVVDLTETSFVDSTSLGVLLGALKRQREEGGELRIVVSRPEIRRIFEITLLDQVFPLHETRADALASLSSEAR